MENQQQPSFRKLAKQAVKDMALDWAAFKIQDAENKWDRFKQREEQLKTAGFFEKLKINSAQFLDEFGALLVPCILVFGGMIYAAWRVFFS